MGSVIGMADGSGASTASIKYDAFGNVTSAVGASSAIPSSIGTDFRYHGMQLDSASGLYHVRARTYDARTGRFTSRDPVAGVTGRPETMNPYVFAANNTLVWRDPSGKFGLVELAAVQVIGSVLASIGLPSALAFGARPLPGTGSGGSQPSTFSTTISAVAGGGQMRFEFFIPRANEWGLRGDDRSFDVNPNPYESRAFIDIDFETGTVIAQVNPTCVFGGEPLCNSALPFNHGSVPFGVQNSLEVIQTGDGMFRLNGSLVDSFAQFGPFLPAIDFNFLVHASAEDAFVFGYADNYPALEVTHTLGGRTQFLVQDAGDANPLCLSAFCARRQIYGSASSAGRGL